MKNIQMEVPEEIAGAIGMVITAFAKKQKFTPADSNLTMAGVLRIIARGIETETKYEHLKHDVIQKELATCGAVVIDMLINYKEVSNG